MRLIFRVLLHAALAMLFAASAVAAPDDSVARTTLGNGLRVAVVQNKLAPAATIHMNYLAGSNESPAGFPGTAHAVEHMMFRGSPGLSGEQLNAILANVGGDSNAFTDQTVTRYVSTVPAGDLEVMLRLEAVRMKDILSRTGQWRIEREAINQEVAGDLSNSLYILGTKLTGKLFEGSPYAHDALGTTSSFRKTTTDMLKKFHRDWYVPNNAILVIVGDVDPNRTMETVKELFGNIPPRPLPARPDIKLKPLKAAVIKIATKGAYGVAVVAYRLPGIADKDYAASQVLSAALASPRGKLNELAAQGDLLTASFESIDLPKASGGFVTAAVATGEDLHQKAALLKEAIAEYLAEGVPAELVEAVKHYALTSAEAAKDSIPELAEEWSQTLAMGAYSTPDEGLAAIRNVTVDDVNRVARTYLLNDSAITGLLVPNTSGTPEVIAENFKRSSESFKIKAPKPVKLPAWAQSVMKMPVVANLPAPPADMCLANGLRLIVEHTGNSSLVTLSGSIKHTPQLQTPRGKEGLSDLLDHVMLQGGSTSLDQAQFRAAIYDIGADAAPGTVFSLKVPLDQLERGVALLADAQLHPALPEKVFRISQKKFTDIYRGLKNSPELARDHAYMEAILPKGDPLLHYETAESISKLTLQDLREHHAAVFRPDLTTIVMTGNIKPDRARAIVERYFGAWRAAGPKPDTEFPPIPDNKPLSIMVTDDSSRQADVVLAQSSKLNRAHPDYYPFLLGLNVLSGSAASRLNQSLRENRGLVYAVEADFSAGRTRSFFTVSYGTAPRNVAKVRTLIERDIETMRNTPVAQVDLDQARNTMVRQLELLGTSIDSVVTTLLELAHDDLPLDLPAQAARKVQKITPQQVQAAFRRWIRPGGFVQVTSGPKPSTAGKRQGLH